MSLQPRLLAGVTVVALVSFAACSRPEPPATATPIDPQAVLRQSGQVMQNLESFHLLLRHENGSTQFLPGLNVEEAEGDVVTPNTISISFSGTYGTAFAVRASIVTLGDASYMTNPLTGEWETVATGVSPLGFFDPTRGIGAMTSQVDQAHLLGESKGDPGVHRIGGTIASEVLQSLLGTTLVGKTVQVELTIDADRLFLLEARLTGRVTPTDDDNVIRVITLSKFNEPVDIKAPI